MRPMPELTVEEAPTDELIPYANNAKIHTNEQVEQICTSIQEFGFNDPVAVWDGPEGPEIIEGHGRVLAAKRLGLEKLPVIRLDHLDDAQRRAYTHVHNQLTMNTGWDFAKLDKELDALAELDIDMDDFGFDSLADFEAEAEEDEEPAGEEGRAGSLAERFGVAPFSVLNAREGAWTERKRAWLAIGIRSELGRGGGLAYTQGLMGKSREYLAAGHCR